MATIELKISEQIATFTFNRPEVLNALNIETLRVFYKLLQETTPRRDVSVLILTGAGEKAFIAGADINEMQSLTPIEASRFAGIGQEILFQLEHASQVTIAAVNGFALGGGCEVAMGCDLIYAAEKAKFGQPEVSLGVIPGFGGTQRLLRLIGPMKTRELIYTGATIDASQALQLGLVAQIFPSDQLMNQVLGIAKTIIGKGPEAIRRAKNCLRDGMDIDLIRACAIEREQFALCFSHPDQKEGMTAFLEKRKPVWKE